jgi:hypothetical protein
MFSAVPAKFVFQGMGSIFYLSRALIDISGTCGNSAGQLGLVPATVWAALAPPPAFMGGQGKKTSRPGSSCSTSG